ncbi:hypothetical protein FSHL1_010169 [Fusarium sambucinum]
MASLFINISKAFKSRDWKHGEKRNRSVFITASRIVSVLSVISVVGVIVLWQIWTKATPNCIHPAKRKEWRQLSTNEKYGYIQAVICLSEKESLFEPGSSRYDDFAYMHVFEGTDTHYAAAFLPWHRYFIHTFEKALIEECEFHGSLPYWDWALDAHDLAASPIFDPSNGFGGNGSSVSAVQPKLFGGNCVMDGPFANATRHWQSKSNGHGFKILRNTHCLSRGFQTGKKKSMLGNRVTATAINTVLGMPTYEEFVDGLEVQAHNSIPQFVQGDFYGLTAPNDPVFYLHHAQVDRLWWLWQQQDAENRANTYQGPERNVRVYGNESLIGSSLEDVISLGNVSKPVRVHDVMKTESQVLCYRY